MRVVADPSVLQIIWPGISALLGAGIGGGATLFANHQKNVQEQGAARSSRQSGVKDRSFNACVDLLKAARLLTSEANTLSFHMSKGDSQVIIAERAGRFDEALRNYYAANEVARIAMPPAVADSFDDYTKALVAIASHVYTWRLSTSKVPRRTLH
jgi:hypothetical protein